MNSLGSDRDEMVFVECRCKNCIYSEKRDLSSVLCKYWHRRVKKEHFCREATRKNTEFKKNSEKEVE